MALKSKKLKKTLNEKAVENTTVSVGTRNDQTVKKAGAPNDHFRKHNPNGKSEDDSAAPIVGASIGVTRNMDNYQSLRVDCWLTDTVKPNETVEQAYARVIRVIDKTLDETVQSYIE